MGEVRIVSAERMRRLTTGIFSRAGMSEQDADFMGQCLVDADLRGVLTHGCRFIPMYHKWIKRGIVNPRPKIQEITQSESTMASDADGALGHIGVAHAMSSVIKRAKGIGVAAATVRNSRHCGAMAYYAQMAADAGCIGYAATNGGVGMAPFGGYRPAVGLNPMAWAIPTNRPWALNVDISSSVVAQSKVGLAAEKGEKLPLGWAVDADGNPTDDPARALKGAMLPLGGHKGFGLALVIDVLAGVLGGGRFGGNQGVERFAQQEGQFSQFVLAISINNFMPLVEFKERMDQLIERLKSAPLAPGSKGIFIPGEIEYNVRQKHQAEGIPYPAVVIDEIENIATELGVSRIEN